jgi:hypothetical protein
MERSYEHINRLSERTKNNYRDWLETVIFTIMIPCPRIHQIWLLMTVQVLLCLLL